MGDENASHKVSFEHSHDKAVKVSVQINMLPVKTRQTFVLFEGGTYRLTERGENLDPE